MVLAHVHTCHIHFADIIISKCMAYSCLYVLYATPLAPPLPFLFGLSNGDVEGPDGDDGSFGPTVLPEESPFVFFGSNYTNVFVRSSCMHVYKLCEYSCTISIIHFWTCTANIYYIYIHIHMHRLVTMV